MKVNIENKKENILQGKILKLNFQRPQIEDKYTNGQENILRFFKLPPLITIFYNYLWQVVQLTYKTYLESEFTKFFR